MTNTDLIAAIGVAVASIGGILALFNAWKAVEWKRAELASNFLKDITTSPNLVFACRALEWNGGRLVVPEPLRPLLANEALSIDHDPAALEIAMGRGLTLDMMAKDERLQLYRTALDDLLSWMALVSSALKQDLFRPDDIDAVAYYIGQIQVVEFLEPFIDDFGYRPSTEYLRRVFSQPLQSHKDGRALKKKKTLERGGFGETGRGRSTGG